MYDFSTNKSLHILDHSIMFVTKKFVAEEMNKFVHSVILFVVSIMVIENVVRFICSINP